MPRKQFVLEPWELIPGYRFDKVFLLIPAFGFSCDVHFPKYIVDLLRGWGNVVLINPPETGITDDYIFNLAVRVRKLDMSVHLVGSSFGGRWGLNVIDYIRDLTEAVTLVCVPAGGQDVKLPLSPAVLRRLHGPLAQAAWRLGMKYFLRFDPGVYEPSLLDHMVDGHSEAWHIQRGIQREARNYPIGAITSNLLWLLDAPRPQPGSFSGIDVDFIFNPGDVRVHDGALPALQTAFGHYCPPSEDPAVTMLNDYSGEHSQFNERRTLYRDLLTGLMTQRYGPPSPAL